MRWNIFSHSIKFGLYFTRKIEMNAKGYQMSIEDANMVCIFPIFAWNFQILFQYFTNLLISFLFFFSITVQIHHTFSKYMYFKIHYAWCKIRYLATLQKYWYKLEGYSVELRKKAIFFYKTFGFIINQFQVWMISHLFDPYLN